MADSKKQDAKTDEIVLEQLAKAAKQYEIYVRLNDVTSILPEEATTTEAPVYDWSHPMGLVIDR